MTKRNAVFSMQKVLTEEKRIFLILKYMKLKIIDVIFKRQCFLFKRNEEYAIILLIIFFKDLIQIIDV